jgi:hypothetical protein
MQNRPHLPSARNLYQNNQQTNSKNPSISKNEISEQSVVKIDRQFHNQLMPANKRQSSKYWNSAESLFSLNEIPRSYKSSFRARRRSSCIFLVDTNQKALNSSRQDSFKYCQVRISPVLLSATEGHNLGDGDAERDFVDENNVHYGITCSDEVNDISRNDVILEWNLHKFESPSRCAPFRDLEPPTLVLEMQQSDMIQKRALREKTRAVCRSKRQSIGNIISGTYAGIGMTGNKRKSPIFPFLPYSLHVIFLFSLLYHFSSSTHPSSSVAT